jgi:hypothetical protein
MPDSSQTRVTDAPDSHFSTNSNFRFTLKFVLFSFSVHGILIKEIFVTEQTKHGTTQTKFAIERPMY